MFNRFNQNKANYESGQIFPFLIALVCVVLILVMITINLGQISVYRTDVSIAADAGALAGASTLSGTLLSLGMRSETMNGDFWATLVVPFVASLITVIGIPVAIAIAVTYLIRQYIGFSQIWKEGRMGWANAKKTAMQYAFNNVGIDEPRPTFREFVQNVYGADADTLDAGKLGAYYDIYQRGTDRDSGGAAIHSTIPLVSQDLIRRWSTSGFGRFMSEPDGSRRGFWKWGNVEPGIDVGYTATTGYGWGQVETMVGNKRVITNVNSFDDNGNYNNTSRYQNYVEVTAQGMPLYILSFYNPVVDLIDALKQKIHNMLDTDSWPWWIRWVGAIVEMLVGLILDMAAGIISIVPAGLQFADNDVSAATEGSPLTVTVKRYKEGADLGLWKFIYGTVQAVASANTFPEHGYNNCDAENIRPTGDPVGWLSSLITSGCAAVFKPEKHLFETQLSAAR